MKDIINPGLTLVANTGIKEIIKTVVDCYIKPKLEEHYHNTENEKNIYLLEEKINDYLERSYTNCLYMNTIVFKNEQKKINDLYIPLTVSKCNEVQKRENIKICINKYRDDFIPLYKKVLLVDTAGMGKSTIIKYLYLSAITEKKGIPVLIELRKLDKDISIINFIMNEINGIRQCFKKEDILQLIEGGDFIFFFDGYDEIVPEAKNKITENLEEFISKTSNNTFIISSRDENELSCFGDFQRFDIKSLNKKEAYSLIRKYDENGELSKELIEKLETEENLKILDEFLENPLMVSLLYKAFEYKRTVPYKKHIFYRQVYDALFEEHDLSKGGAYKHSKKSKLDLEDFHRILRSIGFMTLTRGIIYSKEDLVEIIKKAKRKSIDIEFNENDFIYDVTHSVPIFVKDGIEYRWSHKSFQEYFAASYICIDVKEKQEELLRIMSSAEKIYKYYNVLDFCYDIDYKQFARIIIYPTIKELERFYKEKYCDEYYNIYSKEDVNLRKLLEFNYKEILIRKLNEKEVKECFKKELFGKELFKYFFEEWENKGGSYSIINSRFGIRYGRREIETLLRLLYNKRSNIVKNVNIKIKDDIKIYEMLISKLRDGKYQVNDCIENQINQKNIFKLINEYIINNKITSNRTVPLIFDYDKCMELKRVIEDEIEDEKNDVDFI